MFMEFCEPTLLGIRAVRIPKPRAATSMSRSTALWMALGAALAAPVPAYATDGARPVVHHHRIHRVERSALRAQADPPVSVDPPVYTTSHGRGLPTFVTEGLSRNPANCVKYGCIGVGGG